MTTTDDKEEKAAAAGFFFSCAAVNFAQWACMTRFAINAENDGKQTATLSAAGSPLHALLACVDMRPDHRRGLLAACFSTLCGPLETTDATAAAAEQMFCGLDDAASADAFKLADGNQQAQAQEKETLIVRGQGQGQAPGWFKLTFFFRFQNKKKAKNKKNC